LPGPILVGRGLLPSQEATAKLLWIITHFYDAAVFVFMYINILLFSV